ncbi:MAG: ABC transporter permease [Methanocellales archaeon]|nr:ABC transporter permease [Methanocellales archaeon]MDD3291680.1 ABC transporter permease [Methanocellales archaeon]MDD5235030.1 ABC transporter permease [Methanocellales archaeon]MDD5485168.1 ABC transporter permease [Methanocellales archaeon]
MLEELKESKIKISTIAASLILTAFILAVIICLVTHTTVSALMDSMLTEEIRFAIKLSLLTSGVSTVLCIAISIPVAYALARYEFSGKILVNTFLDAPLALPPLVAGVALLILFGTTDFGKSLAEMGLVFVFMPAGIIIAQFFVNVPYMFRILRGTFQGINPRYERVAKTLGCTESQAFWRVTLPMAKDGLLAGSVITWSKGIGEFGAALMVAGATRLKTETLPISLYLNMSCGELNLAIASATILIIISLVSLFIFERYGGFTHAF